MTSSKDLSQPRSRRRVALLVALTLALIALVVTLVTRRDPRTDPRPAPGAPALVPSLVAPRAGEAAPGPAPTGDFALRGRVVDADERPVGGALVWAQPKAGGPPRSATSDATGAFHIDDLAEGEYRLVARKGGLVAPEVQAHAAGAETVVLTLELAPSVQVTVLEALTESPVVGAQIELGQGPEPREAHSDAAGRVVFEGVLGRFHVSARAPGFEPGAHSSGDVSDAPPRHQVVLHLRRGFPIAGTVVDTQGRPVRDARVTALPTAGGLLRSSVTGSGADGGWRFEALSPGVYVFTATAEGFAPATSEAREHHAAGTGPEVRIVMPLDAVLAGRVVDQRGLPVAGAEVRHVVHGAFAHDARLRDVTTDPSGRFEITGLHRGPASLVASRDKQGSPLLRVDLAATPARRDLVLVLGEASIEGVVVSPGGRPVPGAVVDSMFDPDGMPRDQWMDLLGLDVSEEVTTDEQGRFRLAPVLAGQHKLVARWPGEPRERWNLRDHQAAARAGDKQVRLVLDANGGLHGRVVDAHGKPVKRFWLALSEFEGGLAFATPIPFQGGIFRVADIPPGTYVMSISGSDFVRRHLDGVVVPPGESTDRGTITVQPGRVVSGRVTTSDGRPVAGAGVFLGTMLRGDESSVDPGERSGLVETSASTTDAEGRFRLPALSEEPMRLVAEHPRLGRSVAAEVPAGTAPFSTDLVLLPTGVLQGRVLAGEQGRNDVYITARAEAGPLWFNTSSRPDGTYRFDRLAPGRYTLEVEHGPSRATVTILAGETSVLDLITERAAD